MRAGALLDLIHVAALLVQEVSGDVERYQGANHRTALFQRFFLHDPEDGQRQGTGVADASLAAAARAHLGGELLERRAQALAGHLQQPEPGNAAHLDPGPVGIQGFPHLGLHGALVLGAGHVDEVDDDEPTHVPQPELAGNLLGRFQVGVERRFLDVRALGRAGRVDVDGDQGLGGIDDQAAAGRQPHRVAEGGLDLALDLVAAEQRNGIGVELHLVGVVGHHLLDEGLGLLVRLLAVDEHLADVAAQVVANGADDDVVFLIDEGRRLFLGLGLLDGFPELQQVVQIPLHFLGAAADAGGADDHSHALGDLQLAQGLPQLLAVVALDAPGNAAGARIVGHEHQIAAGQADERGERRTLGAAFVLVHLHQHLLAFGDHVLDHGAAAAVLRFVLAGEILAGDFLQRQKAVALRAEVDEGRFQARFHPGDPGLVDARLLLLALPVLDVQVVELLPVYQGDTHLFGLRGVDQHSFHTSNPSVRAPVALDATEGETRRGRNSFRTAGCGEPIVGWRGHGHREVWARTPVGAGSGRGSCQGSSRRTGPPRKILSSSRRILAICYRLARHDTIGPRILLSAAGGAASLDLFYLYGLSSNPGSSAPALAPGGNSVVAAAMQPAQTASFLPHEMVPLTMRPSGPAAPQPAEHGTSLLRFALPLA